MVQVVGSGPNGLAAALALQRGGCDVTVHEGQGVAGGGLVSEALTLPGHLHDVCAAVHPLAVASPYFRALDLAVEWIHPPYVLAHPFDDGTAVLVSRDLTETAAQLGGADGPRYLDLLAPLVAEWPTLAKDVLAPLHLPRAALAYARFAAVAARSASGLARRRFAGPRAQALFAGLAGHGTLPLERPPSAAFGLVLATCAHEGGWPVVRGGSQALARALSVLLTQAGGRVCLDSQVESLGELTSAAAVLLDVSPREFDRLAGPRLPPRARAMAAGFRYGCGVHKVDWVLSEPVPWRARECAGGGTLHLGGTLPEIAAALRDANAGHAVTRPFVLFGQPTQFDASRAPAGGHNAWGYCCVPANSDVDYTPLIEAQVERFAPGFRDVIVARHARTARELAQHNSNLVGGSLAGAAGSPLRFFLGPFPSLRSPYLTPLQGVYLCSAATPPGPGVHGMCGYHAAQRVLRDLRSQGADLYPDRALSIF